MRRVSFSAAKALKEAGCPQNADEGVEHWYCQDGGIDTNLIDDPICSCPTYLEVWLWLWREKKIYFSPRLIQKDATVGDYTWLISPWDMGYIRKTHIYSFHDSNEENPYKVMDEVEDPEEAIIAAIEFLINNDFIK